MSAPPTPDSLSARFRPRTRSGLRAQLGRRIQDRLSARILIEDRGSGSVLALAVVAAILALTAGLVLVAMALAARHQAQSDADASALAAADVASGLVAGVPCEAAAHAAELGGSRLGECVLADGVATVTVTRVIAGLGVRVTSRAGPGRPVGPAAREEPGRPAETAAREGPGLQRLQTRPP